MVIIRMLVSSAVIAGLSYLIVRLVHGDWIKLIVLSLSVLVLSVAVIYFIDMNSEERKKAVNWIQNKLWRK